VALVDIVEEVEMVLRQLMLLRPLVAGLVQAAALVAAVKVAQVKAAAEAAVVLACMVQVQTVLLARE
jgi:hypothetical protein